MSQLSVLMIPHLCGMRLNWFKYYSFIYGIKSHSLFFHVRHPVIKIPFENRYMPLYRTNNDNIFDMMMDNGESLKDYQNWFSPISKHILKYFSRHNYEYLDSSFKDLATKEVLLKPFFYLIDNDSHYFVNNQWRIRYRNNHFEKEPLGLPPLKELVSEINGAIWGTDGEYLYLFENNRFLRFYCPDVHCLRIKRVSDGLYLSYRVVRLHDFSEEHILWYGKNHTLTRVSINYTYTAVLSLADKLIHFPSSKSDLLIHSEHGRYYKNGMYGMVLWLWLSSRFKQKRLYKAHVLLPLDYLNGVDHALVLKEIIEIPNLCEQLLENKPIFWKSA